MRTTTFLSCFQKYFIPYRRQISCSELPIPNDKNLDVSKSKAFADANLNGAQRMESVCYRVENIVGKEEKPAFSTFPTMFSNGFFLRVVKIRDYVVKSKV